jgi:hypothetical protein
MTYRAFLSASLVAVVFGMPVSACGGDDDPKEPTSSPPTSETPSGPSGTTRPNSSSQLPPAFVKCMADRGFDVKSSADIHSAPPDVLQTCFGALHEGGG